jgi:hypothetical protein
MKGRIRQGFGIAAATHGQEHTLHGHGLVLSFQPRMKRLVFALRKQSIRQQSSGLALDQFQRRVQGAK